MCRHNPCLYCTFHHLWIRQKSKIQPVFKILNMDILRYVLASCRHKNVFMNISVFIQQPDCILHCFSIYDIVCIITGFLCILFSQHPDIKNVSAFTCLFYIVGNLCGIRMCCINNYVRMDCSYLIRHLFLVHFPDMYIHIILPRKQFFSILSSYIHMGNTFFNCKKFTYSAAFRCPGKKHYCFFHTTLYPLGVTIFPLIILVWLFPI